MTADTSAQKNLTEAQNWFEHWPDGLLVVDKNLRILAQSPASQRMLGWRSEDLCGQGLHQLLCVNSREFIHTEADCPLCSTHTDATAPRKSAVWRNSCGDNLNVDYRIIALPNAGPARLILSFQDSQSLEYNQAEMEKFAQYADFNPAPIAEFDVQGQLLYGNPALQLQMVELGFDAKGQARIFPEDLPQICEDRINQQISRAPLELNVEGLWFAWHFQVLQDETNARQPMTIMGYAFDITRQKRAEEEVKQQNIAASRDFYAKMMHELRTPLNAIIGFSDLLLRRGQQRFTERELANLTAIKNAGFQLQELVSDTLDISKIEAGKMTLDVSEFAAGDVVKSIETQMRALAEAKGLKLLISCAEGLAMRSDPQKFRQILVNLLSNGIKYTQRGEVRLKLIVETAAPADNQLILEVSDTGTGIPQDLIPKLFKSYQQIKEQSNRGIQGTGLGLALVEELVTLLGGHISVSSVYGAGSCFKVRLPTHLPLANG